MNNRDKGPGFRVEASTDEEVDVYVYDAIGAWYGVDPAAFVKEISGHNGKTMHLRINSPGGDVFDARAMVTAIQQRKGKTVSHIDGLAASAASYLAIAADEVEMSDGAFFMVHNAWTLAMGNRHELREVADLLDKVDASLVKDYRAKTGADEDQVRAWMDAETWFSAEEASTAGFIDRIAEKVKADARVDWDLSAYDKTPAALLAQKPEAPKFDRAKAERRLRLIELSA